jgi:hypothetical protein
MNNIVNYDLIDRYEISISQMTIKVITKLPNSEQSYKGKVKTHNYINRQNQSKCVFYFLLPLSRHLPDLTVYMSNTAGVLIRNCLPFASTWVPPPPWFLVESVLLIVLLFCVVLLCVFTFWVQCCDFRMKTMFSSALHPVVCRRTHVSFTLFVFVYV